jgi:hypothetical protein
MRRQTRLPALAVVCIAVVLGVGGYLFTASGTSTAASQPDPFAAYLTSSATKISPQRMVSIARSESERAGEPNPTISSVSKGSFEDAMRSVDPSTVVPDTTEAGEHAMFTTPVSLVVLLGSFTLQNAHVPPGVLAPKGSVLDLIINERTGAVMGQALPSPEALAAQRPLASTASRNKNEGTIVGTLRIGGGPVLPGNPRSWPARHKRVVVMSRGQVVIARTTTTTDGQFRIRVRPGHYVLKGVVSPSTICSTKPVVVRPAAIVGARLSCSIK